MISMSNTMKIIAIKKNRTGNRSGVSLAGMMPHSYGARLRSLGERGASRPDATKDPAANKPASTNIAKIGKYCPRFVATIMLTSHRPRRGAPWPLCHGSAAWWP